MREALILITVWTATACGAGESTDAGAHRDASIADAGRTRDASAVTRGVRPVAVSTSAW